VSLLHRARKTGVRWVAIFSCCLPPSLVALAGPEAAPVLTETVVTEPIFRGKAHLFMAGPEAAPTVVLVHGLGDKGARDWDGLIAVLARDHRVVAFDLPGFGRSSKGNEFYSPEKYAAFLRYLVEEHIHTRPFSLVGHSMGGAIALRYAARYPQDVTALVLVDVPGILHPMAYSKYLSHLGIDFLPSLYPAQNDHLRNLLSGVLGLMEKAKPAPEAIVANPRLRQSILNAEPAKIAGLALALEDFSLDMPRVQAPVLVLWGGRDSIAPLRTGRVLSANLPHAQLEVFDASGHTPMDDVPESFNTRVAAFLNAPVLERRNVILQRELLRPVSTRTGTCKGQRGAIFEGEYDRIIIHRCRDTLVRNARVRELRISDAVVSIEDSVIGGTDGGLNVDDARVTITSSVIEGRVAITAVQARLDIAGSRIVGREAAVVAPLKSEVLFSVSRVQSPHFRGSLHELRIVTPSNPL
jgi:pimeloyl-ACP methyl ester carboxylesterase